ncbi:fructosamine kinase family protein [Maribacter flavus]|uniref:Fructosamine kinase family protein n=1 Tax=Maribacter flavus TaxID=1658664 RepID=A0A5B2TXL0_9FLAO|nr:fructosamine kinase family protein [Maribacter flavus]KAA2219301.1 fructosamine kinase family protein [Maribacter flavus]
MDKELIAYLNYLLCTKIERVSPISGGDISRAYLLESTTEKFFCKINGQNKALAMFHAEKKGLQELLKTNTIAAPRSFQVAAYEAGAFFLMEYVETKRPCLEDMSVFGRQLAQLHQLSNSQTFGWEEDNFIGSLNQSNRRHVDWTSFYVQERLLPQLYLAFEKGLLAKTDIPPGEKMDTVCNNLFPKVKPSLLHGDLWSGNFLISKDGVSFLIDPAIYYGHHEVDIAMTRLFGGFGDSFYKAYREIIPPEPGEEERKDIYQLYYLLVHLNLFGASYAAPVKRILSTYF